MRSLVTVWGILKQIPKHVVVVRWLSNLVDQTPNKVNEILEREIEAVR